MSVRSQIEKSTRAFVEEHPGIKYNFFGGKGGAGKSVMAGTAALWHARQGKRTLLTSMNPVHSLTGMLRQDVLGKPTLLEGESSFWTYEIDTKDTIEESEKKIREKTERFLKSADIGTKAEDFVGSATMSPAFEESALFENIIVLMFEDEHEVYVFDTAPTANNRRLRGMSDVYSMWGNKMVQSREEAQSLKELLSHSRKKEEDPLMEYLLTFRDRLGHAKGLLTDDEKTASFFIILSVALPIAMIEPLARWFEEFGIPVGAVIVNMRIDPVDVWENLTASVRHRIQMQQECVETIWERFDNVRAVVSLFATQVHGVEMLEQTANHLFAEQGGLGTTQEQAVEDHICRRFINVQMNSPPSCRWWV